MSTTSVRIFSWIAARSELRAFSGILVLSRTLFRYFRSSSEISASLRISGGFASLTREASRIASFSARRVWDLKMKMIFAFDGPMKLADDAQLSRTHVRSDHLVVHQIVVFHFGAVQKRALEAIWLVIRHQFDTVRLKNLMWHFDIWNVSNRVPNTFEKVKVKLSKLLFIQSTVYFTFETSLLKKDSFDRFLSFSLPRGSEIVTWILSANLPKCLKMSLSSYLVN